LLLQDRGAIKRNVAKALELLPPGTPMHSRAQDIQYLLEGMDKPG
jgi:hypothetical protein